MSISIIYLANMYKSLLASLAVLSGVNAIQPVVQLDYASYRGVPLESGITQWLGIRYATPPLGNLRFRAPQWPQYHNGTQDADAHGPYCLGTGAGAPSNKSDEDCLFLDIYAPTNITESSKLPVFFFIQGGGFNTST